LAAFNNFNSSFYETRRSRAGSAAPVASLTTSAAAAAAAADADADDYKAGIALSGLTHRTDVMSRHAPVEDEHHTMLSRVSRDNCLSENRPVKFLL